MLSIGSNGAEPNFLLIGLMLERDLASWSAPS